MSNMRFGLLVTTALIVGACVLSSTRTRAQSDMLRNVAALNLDAARAIQTSSAAAAAALQVEVATERLKAESQAVMTIQLAQTRAEEAEQRAQVERNSVRSSFVKTIQQFKDEVDTQRSFYQRCFVILTAIALGTALLSSIFGFIKLATVAGVCGLLTTGALAAPSAFSVRENLDFYKYVSNQSQILLLETAITERPSEDDVRRWKSRFGKLMEIWGNPPATKDPDALAKTIVQPTRS